jgi:hypothetical protein
LWNVGLCLLGSPVPWLLSIENVFNGLHWANWGYGFMVLLQPTSWNGGGDPSPDVFHGLAYEPLYLE